LDEFELAFSTIGLNKSALQSSYAMAENVFAVSQSSISSGPLRIWADGARFRNQHIISLVEPTEPGALCFVSSGQLLPNHEIRIVSDTGSALSDGQVGEILVKSNCLFQGYYNRPDLTADAFVDGFYRTGDLGFLCERELFVVGRTKDLLIIGGENLYPQDIEEIVASHPAVHDGRVVAMGIFDPDLGTEGIVVVAEVEREEQLSSSAEIESAIRSSVVGGLGVSIRTIFFKPTQWIVKSTAGKPARSATRDKLLLEHPDLAAQ
jgi:acyl-CoA synthetase (AMP-forming)/AMP-acid ligase II